MLERARHAGNNVRMGRQAYIKKWFCTGTYSDDCRYVQCGTRTVRKSTGTVPVLSREGRRDATQSGTYSTTVRMIHNIPYEHKNMMMLLQYDVHASSTRTGIYGTHREYGSTQVSTIIYYLLCLSPILPTCVITVFFD